MSPPTVDPLLLQKLSELTETHREIAVQMAGEMVKLGHLIERMEKAEDQSRACREGFTIRIDGLERRTEGLEFRGRAGFLAVALALLGLVFGLPAALKAGLAVGGIPTDLVPLGGS